MSAWIGDIFTSRTGWEHLESLVDLGDRMAGSDGERQGAEATRDVLESVGVREARLEPFDIQGWERGTSAVHAGDTQQSSIALPRSPAGEASGELIDVGYGLPEDFDRDLEGAVVMAASNVPEWYDRFIHRREKYYYAVESGASAFIFRNHIEGCLPPTGSIGSEEAPIGDIPAVGVSKEVGARLRRRWEGESVTVSVDATIDDATSHNVHAEIGPDTDTEILVTSHIDAHDIAEGAWDNGAGTAVLVDMAKALVAREDDLDTKVHFIAYGAEEVGLVGSAYDAEHRDHDTVKAIINNDGVVRGRTLKCYTHGFDELTEAVESVADRTGYPVSTTPRLGPHSDHWPYVQWGVPGYHMMSETGSEGRGWGHTAADTFDKLELRDLREQVYILSELAIDIADDGFTVAHRDPDAIAAQLEDENLAEGMKITGSWPYA